MRRNQRITGEVSVFFVFCAAFLLKYDLNG
jgi:hypothetical protein